MATSGWRTVGVLLLAAGSTTLDASPLLLSGEVRSTDAEAIFVPPSNSSPVVLRYYVAEGARVAAGDVLVRIDPGQSASQVETLSVQIEQTEARVEKEVAELQLTAIDAERAALDAWLALQKAEIDAAIPREHLSALDADRYAGELERASREHVLKQQEFASAREAVARRREDGRLEVDKLRADLRYHEAQVANAEQRATRSGVVVHGFDRWQGKRYDEGSSAHQGLKIGEVVGDGDMFVRAWALESDRADLGDGQRVTLRFDALPGATTAGRIERIAGAPEPKAEWGGGRYFAIDIALESQQLPLLSGMSVLVVPERHAPDPEAAP